MNHWKPSATLGILRKRADLLRNIRSFFNNRDILEVDTPLLSAGTISDPAITPIAANLNRAADAKRYLQTSPEFHMKRLLAAGSGSIYQISKAFRDDEIGRHHNPEFTMLEWYRVNIDYKSLINEIATLLETLGAPKSKALSYADLFQQHCALNPHTTTATELQIYAQQTMGQQIRGLTLESCSDWLDLIFSHQIQPSLGNDQPTFVFDYPVCQAALAKTYLEQGSVERVAQRFELFYKGIELANGYQELTDAEELVLRLELEGAINPERPIDPYLIAAQQAGLPECSGVALGLDRLLMTLNGLSSIKESISFDFNRA